MAIVRGTDNADQLIGTPDADELYGGKANDTLVGSAGNDLLDGGNSAGGSSGVDLADYAAFTTAFVVDLSAGTASSGSKTDRLVGIEWVKTGSGDDRLTGTAGTARLDGGAGNDTIDGSGGELAGGDGSDLLRAGSGDTTLDGGAGQDTLRGGSGSDLLQGGAGDDSIDGGGGIDRLSFADAAAGVAASLATGRSSGGAGSDQFTGIEVLIGSGFADTLDGSTSNDTLDGGAGADLLRGDAGDDVFIGLNAGDTVEGGAGFDSYAIADTVPGESLTVDLADPTITFRSVEAIYGSKGGARLLGDDGANFLDGRVVVGRGGNDVLFGRAVDYSASTSALTITPGVQSMALPGTTRSWTVHALVRNGTEQDGIRTSERLLLGSGSDVIEGASAAVWAGNAPAVIDGGAGNDRLVGSTLIGGAGDDTLVGAMADYQGAPGAVRADLATGRAVVSDGTDTLVGIVALRGSAFADTLTGNTADNTLEGGAGNDTLDGGAGFDTASFDDGGAAVVASLATSIVTRSDGSSDRLVAIEALRGSAGNDRLTGSAGDNLLWGGLGDDTLDGGAGRRDVADYRGSQPVDVDLTLGRATQPALAIGSAALVDELIGIEAVFGSSAGDRLRGLDGAANLPGETLRGGGGDDTLIGGSGIDTAEFSGRLADYTITRNAGSLNLGVSHNGGGADGTDTLEGVELLMFSDRLVAFGPRAEEVARVAFALWTPPIVNSPTLFSKGISFYSNEFGYSFDFLCQVALQYWPESGAATAARLKASIPGAAFTTQQLIDIMASNGGVDTVAGRAAAVKAVALDPATTAQLELAGVPSRGVVATHSFPSDPVEVYFTYLPG